MSFSGSSLATHSTVHYSECDVMRCQLNIRLNFSAWKWHHNVCHLERKGSSFTLPHVVVLPGGGSQPSFVAFKTAELLRQYDVYCNLRLTQFFFGWIIGSVSYLILSAISIDRLLALSLHLRYNSIVTVSRVTKLVIVIWLLISIVTASKIWLGDKWVVFPIVINVFSIFTTAFCTYKIFHIAHKHLKKINKETQAAIHMNSRAAEVVKCKNSALTVI